MIANLTSLLKIASFPGHYYSTACQRGMHAHCRLLDKWNGERCRCSCGHPELRVVPPTYGELREECERLRAENADLKWRIGVASGE